MADNIKVSGTKAKLIQEGKVISDRMKVDKKRLDEIKKLLGYSKPTTYVVSTGSTLTISDKKQYEPIKPIDALKALKAKRLGLKFPECVTVVLKGLQRFLTDDEIAKIRKEKDNSSAWSFR